jgi:hypothetical protein
VPQFHIIKIDPKRKAPVIALGFFGGMRVRYHVMLISPEGGGHILQEWRGNNWDKEKDDLHIEVPSAELLFAPLSWQFDIFPNPGIPGERYRITLDVVQESESIFLREYENAISVPEILTEDAVFVPKPQRKKEGSDDAAIEPAPARVRGRAVVGMRRGSRVGSGRGRKAVRGRGPGALPRG